MTNSVHTLSVPETLPRTWRLPSLVKRVLRFARRKPLGAIGGAIVLALLAMAIFADQVAPYPYATLMATAIGVSSAYLGGAYDIVVQRVVDAWMSFPALVVVLSLMAALGPGLANLILALSILGAASASRVIRGATLSVMANPYVEAARAVGA